MTTWGSKAQEWAVINVREQKLSSSLCSPKANRLALLKLPKDLISKKYSYFYKKKTRILNCFSLLFFSMDFLIFSGRRELCIFKVFLTGMKATDTVILKLQWRFSWNHIIPVPWTWSEIPFVRNPLMEEYKWAVLCGAIFYPFFIFISSPWISSIPWTCGSHAFYKLTEHPIAPLTTHVSRKRAS